MAEKQVPIFVRAVDLHLYENAKFVDVRDAEAYATSHMKDAVNANDLFTYLLPTSSKDALDQMKSHFQSRFGELGISGKEHVIVYEQSLDNQYGASCRGFFIFKYMNHPKVSTLEGGFDAVSQLRDGSQCITKEPSVIAPCQYEGQAGVNVDWQMADRDEVMRIVHEKPSNKCLLDVRDAIEWNGLSSSPYGVDFTPRKGRIPNSIWIEWYAFHELDKNQNVLELKSNEQIQALVEGKGIHKDDEIVIFCFKGSRASVALMKLKEAGYHNLKNYFASWNEWSRDFQLPIDESKIIDSPA